VATEVEVIYCSSGNRRFADIAIASGMTYGAQLPGTVYRDIEFADQNWKKPDRNKYMDAVRKHIPRIATVVDWETPEQLPEVLDWAEEIAAVVDVVIVIPKVMGGISLLPRRIGEKETRLGYSVPTSFGGTQVPAWEFSGWPVHLLGGSPHKQMQISKYLDVRSVDGNQHRLMAVRHCQFWVNGTAWYAKNRYWPLLKEANDGKRVEGDDLIYDAFERSCKNILEAWKCI
jgi:hypothetical protein